MLKRVVSSWLMIIKNVQMQHQDELVQDVLIDDIQLETFKSRLIILNVHIILSNAFLYCINTFQYRMEIAS